MTVCDVLHPKGSTEPNLRNRSDPNALVAVEVRSRALIDRVIDTILDYA